MTKSPSKKRIAWKISRADPTIASTRYRCLVPIRHLSERFESRLYARHDPVDFAERLDAMVFVKSFTDFDKKLAQKCKTLGIPIYFDLCDNIFDRPPFKTWEGKWDQTALIVGNFKEMARIADGIVTTGPPLAERIARELDRDVPFFIIPDGMEDDADIRFSQEICADQRRSWMFDHGKKWIITRVLPRILVSVVRSLFTRPKHVLANLWNHIKLLFFPVQRRVQHKPTQFVPAAAEGPTVNEQLDATAPRLLWFGHAGIPGAFGLTDLSVISEELSALYRKRQFILVVVSNNYDYYLKYVKPLPFPTCYEDWSVSTIGDRIRSCEVTIVPNPLNRFTLMKSANRTILSLFHGVPVVATRTSALEPFEGCVVFDSWTEGIITYLDDPKRAQRDVAAGRAVIQARFSGGALAESWQALFDGKLQPYALAGNRGKLETGRLHSHQ